MVLFQRVYIIDVSLLWEYHHLRKAFVESIDPAPGSSFAFKEFRAKGFPFHWHFHPEIELTLIVKGRGRRFVGDNIGAFSSDELVLLGSDLPHTWESERRNQKQHGDRCHSIVIQFRSDFLGNALQIPVDELRRIVDLLDRARRGLQFGRRVSAIAAQSMQEMRTLAPLQRLTTLLEILDLLSRDRNAKPISSAGFHPVIGNRDQKRVTLVCELLNAEFTRPIKLAEAADLAGLSESAFARFFRRATGKHFTAYLTQLRIARACELMIETEKKIAAIALESGFGNLSYFNRIFRREKGITPREFRSAYGG